MSDQLLRCGTSIGANVREGLYAQSRKDFISKLHIALKEAGETDYWLVQELLSIICYLLTNNAFIASGQPVNHLSTFFNFYPSRYAARDGDLSPLSPVPPVPCKFNTFSSKTFAI